MTAREKVKRDARVVSDRARGLTWSRIAERHELGERQCRTIWRDARATSREADSCDPVADADEVLAQLAAVVEDAALLAETTTNDAVRVSALKLRLAALLELVAARQALGLLPPVRQIRHELDLHQTAQEILRVFREHEVPPEVYRAVQRALRQRNGALAAA